MSNSRNKIFSLLSSLALISCTVNAQQDIYIASGGNIYTHPGGQMGIFGNIINDGAGGLNHNNAGDVYLYRRAAQGTGNSRIYDGPSAPSYTGNYNTGGAYVRFWNLYTDNTTGTATPSGTPINGTTGSGQISLEQECRVSGTHSFVNGMVWTPRNKWKHAYLHYDNSTATYSGSANTIHIDGYAAKTGTSNFDFPIGDGNRLRTSGLRTPASGTYKSAYFNNNAMLGTTGISGNNASTGPYMGLIVRIDQSEFWDIDGTASSKFMLTALNSVAGYSDWNIFNNFFNSNPAKIVITGFDPWENLGISPVASSMTQDGPFVSTTATTPDGNFSAYTWATTDIVLPVSFKSFNAKTVNCRILLNWEVENSAGIHNYVLQRSENGLNFNDLAIIDPGTASLNSFTIDQPGTYAFYRIRLNLEDGSYRFGPVLPVEKKCNGQGSTSLKIYPNPVRSILQVIVNSDQISRYDIVITNLLGQRLLTRNVYAEAGANLYSIDLSGLPAAMYTLSLFSPDGVSPIKTAELIRAKN